MTPGPAGLRWKCPHCDVGVMKLRSADRHLRNKHFDCASCRIERLVVQAIMEGKGHLVEAPVRNLWRPASRARV